MHNLIENMNGDKCMQSYHRSAAAEVIYARADSIKSI